MGNPLWLNMDVHSGFTADIILYNAVGQEIRMLGKQQIGEGEVQLSIDTQGLSKGIYYVQLRSTSGTDSKRVIIAD